MNPNAFRVEWHECDHTHAEVWFEMDIEWHDTDELDGVLERFGEDVLRRSSLAAAGTLARLAMIAQPWVAYSAQLHCRPRLILDGYRADHLRPEPEYDTCRISELYLLDPSHNYFNGVGLGVIVPKKHVKAWAKQLVLWLGEIVEADAGRRTETADDTYWTVTPTKLWQEWSQRERELSEYAEQQDRERIVEQQQAQRQQEQQAQRQQEPEAKSSLPEDKPEQQTREQLDRNARGRAAVTAALEQRPDDHTNCRDCGELTAHWVAARRDGRCIVCNQRQAAS
jgi:hypothetical protein